jgi:hypothetical protein
MRLAPAGPHDACISPHRPPRKRPQARGLRLRSRRFGERQPAVLKKSEGGISLCPKDWI